MSQASASDDTPYATAALACIMWTGATDGQGRYGVRKRSKSRKNVGAHRLALEIKLGRELLPGMHAAHICGVSLCVNPDHLYEATPSQNESDKTSLPAHMKPRASCKRGHSEWHYAPSGRRWCVECAAMHDRQRRARIKEAKNA